MVVSRNKKETTEGAGEEEEGKRQEYITAILPGQGSGGPACVLSLYYHSPMFPGGQSQYISLPADPRVLSGEYSYAVLQQADGSSQIVLMENGETYSDLC